MKKRDILYYTNWFVFALFCFFVYSWKTTGRTDVSFDKQGEERVFGEEAGRSGGSAGGRLAWSEDEVKRGRTLDGYETQSLLVERL